MQFLGGALLYVFGLSPLQTIPRLVVLAPFENCGDFREEQPFEHSMEPQLAMVAVLVLKALCGPQLFQATACRRLI